MGVALSFDYDDELIKARSAQGMGGIPPSPIDVSPTRKIGLGPSSIDSLAPHKENIMLKIIRANERTEQLTEMRTKNFETESARAFSEMKKLSQEMEESFKKEIEVTKDRDTWSTLSIVSQYIASVGALTMAISIGGIAGFLLGAAGVVGGAVRLAHDTHLLHPITEWLTASKELQKSIQKNIDLYGFCLQASLSVAGGFAAWQAGAFAAMQAANMVDYVTRASSVLETTGMVMKTGSQVGVSYCNTRLAEHAARTRELSCGVISQKQDLSRNTKQIQETLESNESEIERIRRMIQKQEVYFD